MERWRILYLIIVAIGFLVGWLTSPKIAVAFVWVCILSVEFLHRR